jgi:hypothetical protein
MNPLIAAYRNPSYEIGHITFWILVILFAIWLLSAIFRKFL